MQRFLLAAAALCTLTLAATGLTGCATDGGTDTTAAPGRLDAVEARALGGSNWNALRRVMNPGERADFDLLRDVEAKTQYVRSRGIDVRYYLSVTMQKGMSPAQVEQTVRPYVDSFPEAHENEGGKSGWLHVAHFNGDFKTSMDFLFVQGASEDDWTLDTWTSYVDGEHSNPNAGIEAAIQDRLDRVLKPGMGELEVATSFNAAKNLQDAIGKLYVPKRSAEADPAHFDKPGYKGLKSTSINDYAVETDWLSLQGMTNVYELLNRKADYVRTEGTSSIQYVRYPATRDKTRYVVIEYRYEYGRLKSWWVYSTDFLGYEGFKG